MVITYESILNELVKNAKIEIYKLVVHDVEFSGELVFERNPDIEKLIDINVQKKIEFIERHYHNGPIVKKKPCITKIEGNTIYFRSSRAFPTLYIDLLVLSKKYKYITLKFDKLFVGYHIVGLDKFYTGIKTEKYDYCLEHWKERFTNNRIKKLQQMNKFYSHLMKVT